MPFGFPTNGKKEPSFRVDTSKQQSQLIDTLRRSEKHWQEDQCQKSMVQLRKGINLLEYLIKNASVEQVRQQYETKLGELKKRLQNRENEKNVVKQYSGGGGGPKGPNNEDDKMRGQISDAIVTQKPNIKWEDVSGLQNAKNALKEAVILPIRYPEIFEGQRKPWKGILLYGPPGTGKTFLAKACATEAEGTFISVSSSDLMSKYVGESEKLIRSLFEVARSKKPTIIFIDEIDSMCGNRSEGQNDSSRRVKTQFLVQMQGVGKDDKGILVLGATNLPWALDPAIRRRFERRIYISLPEYQARLGMLKNNLKNNKNSLTQKDFQELAVKTDNFSGSDIAILVRDAVYEPVRRLQNAKMFKEVNGKFTPCRPGENGTPGDWMNFKNDQVEIGIIDRQDFDEALKRTKPSVDGKQLKEYEQFTETFGQDG